MTTYHIIGFLALFFGFVGVLLSGNRDILIKIKSLKDGRLYTAKRTKKTKNQTFLDWFYFDEKGRSIENNDLKKLIYEAFYDEDWYGDYEFVVNDTQIMNSIPTPQQILGGETMPHVEVQEREKKKQVSRKA